MFRVEYSYMGGEFHRYQTGVYPEKVANSVRYNLEKNCLNPTLYVFSVVHCDANDTDHH